MAYRNGTYVAFHAGGTTDPTASDIKYYNTLKMWDANNDIEFTLVNSHEKTGAVKDSSQRETLRRSLIERLKNSKHMLLILTEETRNDTDWVPFEIAQAVDVCRMPIIAAYPDFSSILAPSELRRYWPKALADRVGKAHPSWRRLSFKRPAIFDAVGQFGVGNATYPIDGYGYYNRETQVGWGLLAP